MQKKVKFRKMRELVYQNYRSYMQAPLRALLEVALTSLK
jgi:hypothetical protein